MSNQSATHKEMAVFGPDKITWSFSTKFVKLTRSIDRTNLNSVQETEMADVKSQVAGSCALVKTPTRKF